MAAVRMDLYLANQQIQTQRCLPQVTWSSSAIEPIGDITIPLLKSQKNSSPLISEQSPLLCTQANSVCVAAVLLRSGHLS